MPDKGADFDVVIVGGGLVGISLAIALAPGQHTVALVEPNEPVFGEPAWDERCIAINAASRRIFEGLGIWEALQPSAEPIVSTHISERNRFGVARFTAEEAGEDALGFNIPVRAVAQVLQRRLVELGNVAMFCPGMIRGIEVNPEFVRLQLDSRLTRHTPSIDCRLVVAADGAQSAVRLLLGIGAEERNYEQVAIVGALKAERPHRGVAYERFTPDGPIAVLPKPGNDCSLVWTVPAARSAEILEWDDATFLAEVTERFGHRLGRLTAVGRRNGYPLRRVMSDAITAPRVVFAGNAAQTLHPVAAQGFNLGLRDVATVAELVHAVPEDPGAPGVIAEYAARRSSDREGVSNFTDHLIRVFSNSVPGLSSARHLGLLALDLLPTLKNEVMRRNLGYGGATPALARRPGRS